MNITKIKFLPLFFSSLLFLSMQLFAADYSAIGKNKLGQTILLEEGANGLEINVYVKSKHNKSPSKLFDEKPIESYLFKTECPDWDWNWSRSDPKSMSCSKEGKSPLAKTQYINWEPKGKKDSCGDQARFLRCIKGCESKRVPKVLEELPYECE